MKDLIFIPARSGSKGIKNKNLTKINNKCLIDYTLDFAYKILKNYKNLDILISSDSKKILNRCKSYSYNYDYNRPRYLAKDNSLVIDSILHGVTWYESNYQKINNLIMLQPTNPYRIFKDFKEIYNKFIKNNKFPVVSVIKMKEHPSECIYLKNGKWKYVYKNKSKYYGRQSYDNNFYFIDGSFYLSSLNYLKKNRAFLIENHTNFFKLSHNYPFDIDNKNDLKLIKSFKFLK